MLGRLTSDKGKWISKHWIVQAIPLSRVEKVMPPLKSPQVAFSYPWIGMTVSKKIGHSPCRNTVKRRLREVLRLTLFPSLKKGFVYVFIARAGAGTSSLTEIKNELQWAVDRLHKTFYKEDTARS